VDSSRVGVKSVHVYAIGVVGARFGRRRRAGGLDVERSGKEPREIAIPRSDHCPADVRQRPSALDVGRAHGRTIDVPGGGVNLN
jgi:hypothetical protein